MPIPNFENPHSWDKTWEPNFLLKLSVRCHVNGE